MFGQMMVLCILYVNITNVFLDDQWGLSSLKLARHQEYTVFLKDEAQLLHEQTKTSKIKFYKYVIKVIKTNVLHKKYYSDLSAGVNKFTACSAFRSVLIGKELGSRVSWLPFCLAELEQECGNKERNGGKDRSRTETDTCRRVLQCWKV